VTEFVVTTTHSSLLLYVDSLQKKNAEALSFYPTQVFEREFEKQRLYLGLLNGEPCGYIYRGALKGDVRCHQVCIEYDARRRMYGAQLVACLEMDALDAKCNGITLRCGFDLEANDFWQSMGYRCVNIQKGGVRRMRQINVWRKPLQPQLFEDIYMEPAVGKVDASLWRKNKQTGVVTQFIRGKAMQEYRAKLEEADK
tara:strand:+ start:52 stop:645 length:594 start_codon:yes stop_codon:yes gene_type:complete